MLGIEGTYLDVETFVGGLETLIIFIICEYLAMGIHLYLLLNNGSGGT